MPIFWCLIDPPKTCSFVGLIKPCHLLTGLSWDAVDSFAGLFDGFYYVLTGESASKADKFDNFCRRKSETCLLRKRTLGSVLRDMYWTKPSKQQGVNFFELLWSSRLNPNFLQKKTGWAGSTGIFEQFFKFNRPNSNFFQNFNLSRLNPNFSKKKMWGTLWIIKKIIPFWLKENQRFSYRKSKIFIQKIQSSWKSEVQIFMKKVI